MDWDPAKASENERKHGIRFPDVELVFYEGRLMKPEYDFSKGKRGEVIPSQGKTRVTIYLDNAVLDEFRARSEKSGTGYQTLINQALRAFLDNDAPVDQNTLRRIIREELSRTGS